MTESKLGPFAGEDEPEYPGRTGARGGTGGRPASGFELCCCGHVRRSHEALGATHECRTKGCGCAGFTDVATRNVNPDKPVDEELERERTRLQGKLVRWAGNKAENPVTFMCAAVERQKVAGMQGHVLAFGADAYPKGVLASGCGIYATPAVLDIAQHLIEENKAVDAMNRATFPTERISPLTEERKAIARAALADAFSTAYDEGFAAGVDAHNASMARVKAATEKEGFIETVLTSGLTEEQEDAQLAHVDADTLRAHFGAWKKREEALQAEIQDLRTSRDREYAVILSFAKERREQGDRVQQLLEDNTRMHNARVEAEREMKAARQTLREIEEVRDNLYQRCTEAETAWTAARDKLAAAVMPEQLHRAAVADITDIVTRIERRMGDVSSLSDVVRELRLLAERLKP